MYKACRVWGIGVATFQTLQLEFSLDTAGRRTDKV